MGLLERLIVTLVPLITCYHDAYAYSACETGVNFLSSLQRCVVCLHGTVGAKP